MSTLPQPTGSTFDFGSFDMGNFNPFSSGSQGMGAMGGNPFLPQPGGNLNIGGMTPSVGGSNYLIDPNSMGGFGAYLQPNTVGNTASLLGTGIGAYYGWHDMKLRDRIADAGLKVQQRKENDLARANSRARQTNSKIAAMGSY